MATKKNEINYDEILTIEKGKLTRVAEGTYKELVLPSTIKSIAKDAFGTAKIKKLVLPESLKKIIGQNFKGNPGITEIVICNGTESIGKEAFAGCKSLKKVSLPETVTEIGDKAFKDCAKLIEINIPHSVKSLGAAVFSGCKVLSTITFDRCEISCIDFDSLFKDCKKLISINMIDCSSYNSENGIIFNKAMDMIDFIGEGVKELALPDTITDITVTNKIKKIILSIVPNTKRNIEIETTSIDDIEFIAGGKTYTFNLENEKYSLEKYAYHYSRDELYPKKKEQVLYLLNSIINIIVSGDCSDNDLGKAVYSGWSGSVEIIEPMLTLRISLSEAVSEIYGLNKIDVFDKLFEPVITQDDDFDLANELHNEILNFFNENPKMLIYLEHFSSLKNEIEKVKH